jgi:nitroimidazol reductase NimA-like FMN-containing flavoprotein (pyridoxamine 5'-phosphate oxidase superfamily)
MTRPLRRKDRRMDDSAAMALLQRGEYGILSTTNGNDQPYGIPVHYAVMDETIFFHCATEGQKIDNITANSQVSLCVVGKAHVIPEKFATCYESVILSGNATIVDDPVLRKNALRALIVKYAPDHIDAGEAYMDKLFDQTAVIRIAIDHLSGKARK